MARVSLTLSAAEGGREEKAIPLRKQGNVATFTCLGGPRLIGTIYLIA